MTLLSTVFGNKKRAKIIIYDNFSSLTCYSTSVYSPSMMASSDSKYSLKSSDRSLIETSSSINSPFNNFSKVLAKRSAERFERVVSQSSREHTADDRDDLCNGLLDELIFVIFQPRKAAIFFIIGYHIFFVRAVVTTFLPTFSAIFFETFVIKAAAHLHRA